MIQRTLIVLKPDALERGLVGEIIGRLERCGLKLLAIQMREIGDALARAHYDDLEARIGSNAYSAVIDYMTSGPVIAMVVEGDGAVPVVRKLIGATFPVDAAPGTVRGDFCHEGPSGDGRAMRNLIHASGTHEDAVRELALWFGDAL